MSQLRPKIAAGLTIVALGGLAGVALSHPQAPRQNTPVQSAAARRATHRPARGLCR